jgi:DNA polymerase-3 subunit beta
MRFSCDRDIVVREIGNAQEVIASRNTLSVLSNVFLSSDQDRLTVRATDLKVGFETSVPVRTASSGSTTVFCDKLLGIFRSLPPGEVQVSLDEEAMLLSIHPTQRKIEFDLRSISTEKYPEPQDLPDELYFEFPQNQFLSLVAKTLFAVSDDETRYFLNGVYLEHVEGGLRMVATDGKRLSQATANVGLDSPSFRGVIIPPKVFSLLRKLAGGEGNLRIAVTDKTVFFQFGPYRLSSNLIDAQFPDYNRVVPANQDKRILVATRELSEALRRVSLLVEQKSRKILVSANQGSLTVHSAEGEMGKAKEEISCQYEGPEVTFALNYQYLLDPLREMPEESAALEFTGADKALTLRAEPASEYFHVIMPMQQG